MADPQPTLIQGYPAGPIQWLFTKDLTNTDITHGLQLVGNSKPYLDGLGDDMITSMTDGLDIDLFTPGRVDRVTVKRRVMHGNLSVYRLKKRGWNDCVDSHNFVRYQSVCCWAIFTMEGGLCLLLESVDT
ncbi:hypothetical protein CFOL_v3_04501 [Cephalotus follicularis]|uniref:Uncharacterized protein n=1 Tax=Cephalotus follicularis TaxID=3775 RepID=A0A1Q3AZK9_CEPFO|nr:hypothetical protein CFOL_v3_04501 [Cephalotus follicularis]